MDLYKISDQTWEDLILEKINFDFHFLALNILFIGAFFTPPVHNSLPNTTAYFPNVLWVFYFVGTFFMKGFDGRLKKTCTAEAASEKNVNDNNCLHTH